MKVVGLISGGKDSCYNLMQCVAAGHEILALANLSPVDKDELDSYMYQSVGHMGISLYADAMGLPLYRRNIKGSSLNTASLRYSPTDGDEVEDLFYLLQQVKDTCGIEAVSVGAVLSEYQRIRVENVCQRLNLVPLAYLWRRDQSELLKEMIDCGVDAIVIKVASYGLKPSKHLGKSIKELQPIFEEMKDKYRLNICGEGGEYETFTLDCPLFHRKIVVKQTEMIQTSDDVAYLNLVSLQLEDIDQTSDDWTTKVRTPLDFLSDLELNEAEQQAEDQAKESSNRKDPDKIECQIENVADESTIHPIDSLNGLMKSSSGFSWSSVHGSTVKEAIAKLKSRLEENCLSIENVISVRLFVQDLNDPTHNQEYAEHFVQLPPTRAFIQLPDNLNLKVCIDAFVWEDGHQTEDSSGQDSPRYSSSPTFMHVQSISHWAPANIGPYSQAAKVGDIIFIAGMIGLVPGTLELLKGTVEMQSRLALRHVDRVIAAIAPKSDIRAIVQGVCYVTDVNDIPVARRMMARLSESQISTYVVVPALPRQAQVEWHTWAHINNTKFDYEEKGFTRSCVNVRLRRRFSADNSICAVITTIGCSNLSEFEEVTFDGIVDYTLQNACSSNLCNGNLSLNVTVFYKVNTVPQHILKSVLVKYKSRFVSSLIPVLGVEDKASLLSIVAVRH